jgi:hypothetical protein
LPLGIYRIGWYWEWNINNTSGDGEFRVQLNDSMTICEADIESQDGSNYHPFSGFYHTSSISGIQNIDIDIRRASNGTLSVRRARLEIWRVS